MGQDNSVSIVIPAYNEELQLAATIHQWINFLSLQDLGFEIIVVNDGSTDETRSVIADLMEAESNIRPIDFPINRGKGAAVRTGVLEAIGKFIFYTDADMSYSPHYLIEALTILKHYDVVIGQRSLWQYLHNERNVVRILSGALIQIVRRAILLPTIADTQCGFKGFRGDIAKAIFPYITVSSFAFDIEVLFLAKIIGARINEMPVNPSYRSESTFVFARHFIPMLRDIMLIRKRHITGGYADLVKSRIL